jgi:hypothetical protein
MMLMMYHLSSFNATRVSYNFVREISYLGASEFRHSVANGRISVKQMVRQPAPLRRRLRLPQERLSAAV